MQSLKGQSVEDNFPGEKTRHLYIVLDEWSGGYSIRKIDLLGDRHLRDSMPSASSNPSASFNPSASSLMAELVSLSSKFQLETLPPAFFKFEAPRRSPMYFAGAFDSKILAMQPLDPKFNFNNRAGVPIYDVHMQSLMIGPRQRPDPVDPIYFTVSGKLFALAAGSFQLLYAPPRDLSGWEDFAWMWHTLPEPPFQRKHVTSYTMHSDGRTILVSTQDETCAPATFSFDTEESVMRNACMWKQQGQWKMPFHGRAFFVPELDAWVGLSGKPGPDCRLCSMKGDATLHEQVKFCKEPIFLPLPAGGPVGGTLISIGGNRFCTLEFTTLTSRFQLGLQLMTFSVRYDKNGDLKLCSFKVRHYIVPVEVSKQMLQIPVAFWI